MKVPPFLPMNTSSGSSSKEKVPATPAFDSRAATIERSTFCPASPAGSVTPFTTNTADLANGEANRDAMSSATRSESLPGIRDAASSLCSTPGVCGSTSAARSAQMANDTRRRFTTAEASVLTTDIRRARSRNEAACRRALPGLPDPTASSRMRPRTWAGRGARALLTKADRLYPIPW